MLATPPIQSVILVDKVVAVSGFFAAVFLVAILLYRYLGQRMALLREHEATRQRVLGMIHSLDELRAFVATEEGRRLMEPPAMPVRAAHGVRMIQAGVVVLVLAGGIWAASGFEAHSHGLTTAAAGLGLMAGGLAGRSLNRRWSLKD